MLSNLSNPLLTATLPPSTPLNSLTQLNSIASKDDAAVELMITLYWLVDVSGSTIGLIGNAFLILACLKTSGRQLQSYSYLFLVTAVFDVFYSIVELLTQHQLVVRKGVMFVLPHGVEWWFPRWTYWCFMLPHGTVAMHGLYILGAQYKYRHDLITRNDTNLWTLLKAIACTAPCGLFSGLSLAYSIYESKRRGDDYYMQLMDGPWFNDNARRYFMYACDIRDVGGILFFYGGLVLSTFWVGVSVFYSWKAYKHVHKTQEHATRRSERTKALMSQFTRVLIVQTVNAALFAVIPISLICTSMIFKLDAEFLGMGTMSPLSWLPAVNAILSIYIMKPYRAYVRNLFCYRLGFLFGRNAIAHESTNKFTEVSVTNFPTTTTKMQPTEIPVFA